MIRPAPRAPARMLCLTTADDETFGWLDAFDSLVNLPYLLLHFAAFAVTLAAVGVAHWLLRWDFGRGARTPTQADVLFAPGARVSNARWRLTAWTCFMRAARCDQRILPRSRLNGREAKG